MLNGRATQFIPQGPQYDGFTPRRRVSGRAPVLPIETAGNPHFRDRTNPNDPPVAQTKRVFSVIERNPTIVFIDRFPRGVQITIENQFPADANRVIPFTANSLFVWKACVCVCVCVRVCVCVCGALNRFIIARAWVIIGKFSYKPPPSLYMSNTTDADLNGHRSTNKIFDISDAMGI